jgi:hypothetical protein
MNSELTKLVLRSTGAFRDDAGNVFVYATPDDRGGSFGALRVSGRWKRASLTIGDLTGYDSDWTRIGDVSEVEALLLQARVCLAAADSKETTDRHWFAAMNRVIRKLRGKGA